MLRDTFQPDLGRIIEQVHFTKKQVLMYVYIDSVENSSEGTLL